MSKDIELEDLASKRRITHSNDEANTDPKLVDENIVSQDGTIGLWAWTSAAIFIVFSTSLILFPRFLLFLAEPSGGRSVLSTLESFLAVQLGIVMGAVAFTLVVTIPDASPTGFQQDANAHPLLVPVTIPSVLLAFLSYNKSGVGSLGTFIFLGSTFVGLFGFWVLLFAGTSTISQKTGADKRTSAFMFGNKNAASVRKKEWRKQQQQTRNNAS
ncbi:hypothetical protein K503DRAFT_863454 [Rhizopogon vinicolor AM-OR11-026]|uniref:Uncharacterized protein n=1 Tax=Rhizopogon vinicolor AM-OR11-026 TaxID=1314800 RepID=A0A1B7NAN9_9AGAM|nr:hypothetical protein K503DRAFT_863454 [Rhizopogon vinicolor AM-OR11-026]